MFNLLNNALARESLGQFQMIEGLFESSKHAERLSDIHMDIVLGLLSTSIYC